MSDSREDEFIKVQAILESRDNPNYVSSDGYRIGRYGWQTATFAHWAPRGAEYGERPLSWDEFGELALRRFFRAALVCRPWASDAEIAMAFHLHGHLLWWGWDVRYAKRRSAIVRRRQAAVAA